MEQLIQQELADKLLGKTSASGPISQTDKYNPGQDYNLIAFRITFSTTKFTTGATQALWPMIWKLTG